MNLVKIGKYISLLLRHRPEAEGLHMDEHGWVDAQELIDALARKFPGFDRDVLDRIVAENDKKRYSYSEDGTRIRANQGHSIDVDVEMPEAEPPEILWHGSAERFASSIEEKGLLPQSRRYVHLSMDKQTAYTVGKRHGKPVIYMVRSGEMYRDGYIFYCSANGVWQTAAVPVRYLYRQ
ncbi:MAG: RNA 2'-phosphotransferase [Solobacterium sp.]|nr:RNA 2'-phosphotransferase [Solobacterium sp.]